LGPVSSRLTSTFAYERQNRSTCGRRLACQGRQFDDGLTTAATYALAGLVDWRVAAIFVLGGIAGGLAGVKLSVRLSEKRGVLSKSFAVAVIFVAAFVLCKSSAGILR
jgi:hypothetical protein